MFHVPCSITHSHIHTKEINETIIVIMGTGDWGGEKKGEVN